MLLRDGAVVGRPTYPAGTSIATTNVNERLVNAVQACFAQMGEPYGLAEGAVQQQAGESMISGVDSLNGGEPYVNQLFIGYGGGPAKHGTDGWLTYLGPVNAGTIVLDSIEIDEGMYPFIVETRKVAVDSLGPGRWNGAPGMTGTFWPLADEMLVIYCSDGCVNPPKGVLGGSAGGAARNMKRLKNGETVDLPGFHEELVQPGEAIIFVNNGGGGYGDPATREPTLVARDVNRGWLSLERAQVVYRVALVQAQNGLEYEVDLPRTETLRTAAAGAVSDAVGI